MSPVSEGWAEFKAISKYLYEEFFLPISVDRLGRWGDDSVINDLRRCGQRAPSEHRGWRKVTVGKTTQAMPSHARFLPGSAVAWAGAPEDLR